MLSSAQWRGASTMASTELHAQGLKRRHERERVKLIYSLFETAALIIFQGKHGRSVRSCKSDMYIRAGGFMFLQYLKRLQKEKKSLKTSPPHLPHHHHPPGIEILCSVSNPTHIKAQYLQRIAPRSAAITRRRNTKITSNMRARPDSERPT